MDLTYKNKEGVSLQQVIDTISSGSGISKKTILTNLKAKKSIDTLLNKLIDMSLIEKIKDGRSINYSAVAPKTQPKIPVSIQTSKDTVTNTVVMPEVEPTPDTEEINQDDLDHLKVALEKSSGKEVTAILHTRNEKKKVKEHVNVKEIFEEVAEQEKEEVTIEPLIDADVLITENPFRFVLNFFTTTLNNEIATPHFKRRDNYVVKSIYNKLKTLCAIDTKYDTEQQHIPFYRAFSISKETKMVKMYHIDMNRIVRGYHNLFKLTEDDYNFIFGDNDEH